MINWEKFLFIPRSALGHFPLTFLCSEISGGTLHLSVPLVQPTPRDERCDGQIVMVLTFCGTVYVNIAVLARSTSLFTSWNCQGTCATLYLYYMIAVELSLWSVFSLFDQRSTAHQLATYVSVKSKLQHPPRAYPAHLTPFLAWEEGNLITNRRGFGI